MVGSPSITCRSTRAACCTSPCLHFATEWPTTDQGGIDGVNEWLTHHPGTKLVVIDTLAKVRPRQKGRDTTLYDEDYQAISQLQTFACKHNLAILIVTHTRKPKFGGDPDPLDEVNATTGLTGAADCVLVLKRARYNPEGKLFVTGRDVEEREISLRFDDKTAHWSITTPPKDGLTPEQRAVIKIFEEFGPDLSIMQVQSKLKKEYDATAQLLARMHKHGLLNKTKYGVYAVSNCQTVAQDHETPVLP